ncbi:hypothetical protein Cni_G19793 [Canna indica]|uniref:30S ribosomal protein 3, chloroplastic n=1 Tax=Canna indica TaxID=4628 RepID=A0AAQ3KNT8_9LILI|nr:hypothetical protein Cni_G19793 [Canna indica]
MVAQQSIDFSRAPQKNTKHRIYVCLVFHRRWRDQRESNGAEGKMQCDLTSQPILPFPRNRRLISQIFVCLVFHHRNHLSPLSLDQYLTLQNIGLALDQVIPGHDTIPLCPYYFWPCKEAWEELKSKIDEKP